MNLFRNKGSCLHSGNDTDDAAGAAGNQKGTRLSHHGHTPAILFV